MTEDIEILIVEDSLTQAIELQHILENNSYKTAIAKKRKRSSPVS